MTIIAKLQELERTLAEEGQADIGTVWPGELLHSSPPFSKEDLANLARLSALPGDYSDFVANNGAVGFAKPGSAFRDGKIRMLEACEIIELTTFLRKETDFSELGFGFLQSRKLKKYLHSAIVFQFAYTDAHARYYLLSSKGEVREWDDDDLETLHETRARSFSAHIDKLVGDLQQEMADEKRSS